MTTWEDYTNNKVHPNTYQLLNYHAPCVTFAEWSIQTDHNNHQQFSKPPPTLEEAIIWSQNKILQEIQSTQTAYAYWASSSLKHQINLQAQHEDFHRSTHVTSTAAAILPAMMEWGGVRIYAPNMPQHKEQIYQDVHASSTKPLMCFKICTTSIKPVKSLLTKHEEGGIHTHTYTHHAGM